MDSAFEVHTYISELQANMREGKMTERRRCAKIVRDIRDSLPVGYDDVTSWTRLDDAAKAIEADHD